MAVNKPLADNARKGAVRKRSQIKIKLLGNPAWAKRNKQWRQVYGREEEQEEV